MTPKTQNRIRTAVLIIAGILLGYFASEVKRVIANAWRGTHDVSRRLTAINSGKTALLERHYGFDFNFRLYILDSPLAALPGDIHESLWSSRDYEKDTSQNWDEELEWSADSSVIAVSIAKQYVFAYDFNSGQRFEDSERIQNLLRTRSATKGQ